MFNYVRYNELKYLATTSIDRFVSRRKEEIEIEHFTAMVWSSGNLLGCGRFYSPDPMKAGFSLEAKNYRFSLICMYASSIEDVAAKAVNTNTHPVYKRGTPCSECYDEVDCVNEKYPSLCGKIKRIPTDAPYNIPDSGAKGLNQRTYCGYSLFFLVVFVNSSK